MLTRLKGIGLSDGQFEDKRAMRKQAAMEMVENDIYTFFHPKDSRKEEFWASLALLHTKGIGPRKARSLVAHFGSAFGAVEAEKSKPGTWAALGLVSSSSCQAFRNELWREAALHEWRAAVSFPTRFILFSEAAYPLLLKETYDAPLILYWNGDFSLLSNPMLAVVGSRNCTREGLRLSAFFSKSLADSGLTIVSGMARGIDRAAHLGGLGGPGSSVAVLGTGLGVVYPPENKDLASLLEQKGLLVTEFSPYVTALARNFPIRNRIISGLCLGVLVIEAAEKSGSLTTARLALEQDREVFAVPGHTTAPSSGGSRNLIRKGAKPVFSADDILVELAPRLNDFVLSKRKKQKESTAVTLDSLSSGEFESSLPLSLVPSFEAQYSVGKETLPHNRSKEPYQNDMPLSIRTKPQKKVSPVSKRIKGDNADEDALLELLLQKKMHVDDLSRAMEKNVSDVSALLVSMEIKGLVNRLPGMIYSLGK